MCVLIYNSQGCDKFQAVCRMNRWICIHWPWQLERCCNVYDPRRVAVLWEWRMKGARWERRKTTTWNQKVAACQLVDLLHGLWRWLIRLVIHNESSHSEVQWTASLLQYYSDVIDSVFSLHWIPGVKDDVMHFCVAKLSSNCHEEELSESIYIYICKYIYIYIPTCLSINAKFCVTCKLMKSENQRQVRLLVRTPHIDSGLWFKVVTINLYKGSSAAAGAVQSGIDLAALGHNKHTPAAVTVLAFCGARAECVFDADRRFFPQREKEKYLMSFVAFTWLAGCHCYQRK